MTIQAHLAELERKHQALEASINDALAHKSSEDLEIMCQSAFKFDPVSASNFDRL